MIFGTVPAFSRNRPNIGSKIDDKDLKITRTTTPVMHCDKNSVLVNFEIHYWDKARGVKKKFTEKHNMRYLFKPELDLVCQSTGFKILEFGEWMTGKKPDFKTWNAYLVARKER